MGGAGWVFHSSAAHDAPRARAVPAQRHPGERMMASSWRSRRGALAAVAVIVAAFAYLLYGGLDKNVVYFLTPKELLAKGTRAVDVPVRLGGQVKPGSVVWNDTTLSLRFTITDGTSEVAVASKGAPPQMFRDGMGVVVE